MICRRRVEKRFRRASGHSVHRNTSDNSDVFVNPVASKCHVGIGNGSQAPDHFGLCLRDTSPAGVSAAQPMGIATPSGLVPFPAARAGRPAA